MKVGKEGRRWQSTDTLTLVKLVSVSFLLMWRTGLTELTEPKTDRYTKFRGSDGSSESLGVITD